MDAKPKRSLETIFQPSGVPSKDADSDRTDQRCYSANAIEIRHARYSNGDHEPRSLAGKQSKDEFRAMRECDDWQRTKYHDKSEKSVHAVA